MEILAGAILGLLLLRVFLWFFHILFGEFGNFIGRG